MNNLIKIFEKHEAESEFIAECVYAYLLDHFRDDKAFINDLTKFLEGESDEI